MVRAITPWNLHNRLNVVLGIVRLVAAGLHSANDLNVEAFPRAHAFQYLMPDL
jgi:heavy metal efflux system protein